MRQPDLGWGPRSRKRMGLGPLQGAGRMEIHGCKTIDTHSRPAQALPAARCVGAFFASEAKGGRPESDRGPF